MYMNMYMYVERFRYKCIVHTKYCYFLRSEEVKASAFFAHTNWDHVLARKVHTCMYIYIRVYMIDQ